MTQSGIIYEMLFSKVQQNGYKVKIHYFQFIQTFLLNAFDEVTSLVLWFLLRVNIQTLRASPRVT